MLLSSVNLIKNGNRNYCSSNSNNQFCDFIIGKIREEQDRRERKAQTPQSGKQSRGRQEVEVFRWDIHQPVVTKDAESKISTSSKKSNKEISHVSIETSDGYYLTADLDRKSLFLEEADIPSNSGYFQQNLYRVETEGEAKRQQLAVFQLTSDKSLFVTTTQDQRLQVTKCDAQPNPEEPDDRFFVLHHLDSGNVFLQPYHHKGYYIHHIDDCLFVRRLEINWRPPEEYFFKVSLVDLMEPEVLFETPSCTSLKSPELSRDKQQKNLICNRKPTSQKISLLFGCFGVKAKKISAKKEKKQR